MIHLKNTMKALLVTAVLATSTLAFAGAADAHACKAEDPKTTCGDCRDGGTLGLLGHNHRYSNNTEYCSSSPAASAADYAIHVGLP